MWVLIYSNWCFKAEQIVGKLSTCISIFSPLTLHSVYNTSECEVDVIGPGDADTSAAN